LGWRIVPVVVACPDNFPDPRGHEKCSDDSKTDESSRLAFPFLIVEDELQPPAAGDLKQDCKERKERPGSKVVVEGVDGTAIHKEALGRQECRNLFMLALEWLYL
jgi:hypothetical protein